jgi:ArsR family transcriptional regulator
MFALDQDCCEVYHINQEMVRQARAQLIDSHTAVRLAEFFQALSDPTRVRILSALSASELCVCDLAATLNMSQSAISHQLRLLRQLHLIKNRKEGRSVYYTLDDEHVSLLFREGLDHVQHK